MNGDGGTVVLWSNYFTNIYGGLISAKGGSQGGNGGWVETSSHNILNVGNLQVDTSAPMGATGTWLLDPAAVTITTSTSNDSPNASPPYTWTPSAGASTSSILNTTIDNELNGTGVTAGNVTIVTTSTAVGTGSITVSSPIAWTTGNSLTLDASNGGATSGSIAINNSITNSTSTSAGLILTAGTSGTITGNSSGALDLANVTMNAQTITYGGAIQMVGNSGTLTLNSSAAGTLSNGVISSGGSSISGVISGTPGQIFVEGGGTMEFTGANTYSNVTHLQIFTGTTLQFGNGGSTGWSTGASNQINNNTSNSTVIFDMSSPITVSASNSGSGRQYHSRRYRNRNLEYRIVFFKWWCNDHCSRRNLTNR